MVLQNACNWLYLQDVICPCNQSNYSTRRGCFEAFWAAFLMPILMPELKFSGWDGGCEKRGIGNWTSLTGSACAVYAAGACAYSIARRAKGHLDFDGGDREAALPIGSGRSVLNLGVRIFFLESGYLRISDYNFAAEGQNRDESQPTSRRKAWVCGPAVTDYNLR